MENEGLYDDDDVVDGIKRKIWYEKAASVFCILFQFHISYQFPIPANLCCIGIYYVVIGRKFKIHMI